MWEKDKQMVYMYRQCIKNFIAEARENPAEVDWSSACVEEGEKLTRYTNDMVTLYKMENPMVTDEQ